MEHREDHNEIPEFTLEDILAEFGSGSDLYRTENLPAEENSPEPAPAEAPAQQEAPAEPELALNRRPLLRRSSQEAGGLRFTPGADPVDMDFPAEVLEEVFSSGGPLLPEEDQPSETQIIHFPHQRYRRRTRSRRRRPPPKKYPQRRRPRRRSRRKRRNRRRHLKSPWSRS